MKYGHKPKKVVETHPILRVAPIPSAVKKAMRQVHKYATRNGRIAIETGIIEPFRHKVMIGDLNHILESTGWFIKVHKCSTSDSDSVQPRLVAENIETDEQIPCRYGSK